MAEETAKQVAWLMRELNMLQDIKNATIKDKSHWWGFIAPDCKTFDSNGLPMPETLRNEFVNALDRSIEIVKAKIEKL